MAARIVSAPPHADGCAAQAPLIDAVADGGRLGGHGLMIVNLTFFVNFIRRCGPVVGRGMMSGPTGLRTALPPNHD